MTLNASLASLKAVCSTSKLLACSLPTHVARRFVHNTTRLSATSLVLDRSELQRNATEAYSDEAGSRRSARSPSDPDVPRRRFAQRVSFGGRVRQIYARMDNPYDLAELINRLCRGGHVTQARLKLEKTPRSVHTDACWNPVIAAYLKDGSYRTGFGVWMDMKRRGVVPTSYAYTIFFNSIDPLKATERAVQYAESVFEQFVAASAKSDLDSGKTIALNAYLNLLASAPRVTEDRLRTSISNAQMLGLQLDKIAYNVLLRRRIRLYDHDDAPVSRQKEEGELVELLDTVLKAHEAKKTTIDALLFSTMTLAWKVLHHRRSTLLQRNDMLQTAADLAGLPLTKAEIGNAETRYASNDFVQLDSFALRGLMLMANLMGQRSSHIAYRWLMLLYERTNATEKPLLDAGHFESAMYSYPEKAMDLLVLMLQSDDARLHPNINTCVAAMACSPIHDAIRILSMMTGKAEILRAEEKPLQPENSEAAIAALAHSYANAGHDFDVRCCKTLLKTALRTRNWRKLTRVMEVTESFLNIFRIFKDGDGGDRPDESLRLLIGKVCDKIRRSEFVPEEQRDRYNKYGKTARILGDSVQPSYMLDDQM